MIYKTAKSKPNKLVFQYNPNTLCRNLIPDSAPAGRTARPVPYSVGGPPKETINLIAEFDTLGRSGKSPKSSKLPQSGVYPQLAALEMILYPSVTSRTIVTSGKGKKKKTKAVVSRLSPFVVLVWGPNRAVPVMLTDLFVVECAFDGSLNPIRASAHLTLEVLTYNDFPRGHPGYKVSFDHVKLLTSMALEAYSQGDAATQAESVVGSGVGGAAGINVK